MAPVWDEPRRGVGTTAVVGTGLVANIVPADSASGTFQDTIDPRVVFKAVGDVARVAGESFPSTATRFFASNYTPLSAGAGTASCPNPVGEADCAAACQAVGPRGFLGRDNWKDSPKCFVVVGGVYSGNCHWNTNANARSCEPSASCLRDAFIYIL